MHKNEAKHIFKMHILGFNPEIPAQVTLMQMAQGHNLENISLDFFQIQLNRIC